MEYIKVHCSRCRSSKLGHNDFEINLKTNEYYKSCIKCMEYDKQFKIKNRDKIRAQAREHYQEIKEIEAELDIISYKLLNKQGSKQNTGLNNRYLAGIL